MTTLELTDGTATLPLHNTQEDQLSQSAKVERFGSSVIQTDEQVLSSTTSQGQFTITGKLTGSRLTGDNRFSNDPLTALAEWVLFAEQFAGSTQGSGFTFNDDVRDESYNVVVKSFGWSREGGAKYEISYDFTFVLGNGIFGGQDGARTVPSTSTGTTWSLDGIDLGAVHNYREDISFSVKIYPTLYTSPNENEIGSQDGARRQITITGTYTGTNAELNQFESDIESRIGQNETYTYASAFPGTNKSVMVEDFSTTRTAGETRTMEYSLSLIEGNPQSQ